VSRAGGTRAIRASKAILFQFPLPSGWMKLLRSNIIVLYITKTTICNLKLILGGNIHYIKGVQLAVSQFISTP
jgi:hypothetical protein